MDKQTDLISRLQDEADLCRNDGATDIAALLDEAVAALQAPRPEVAGAWGEPVLLPCDCKDAEIGRQWRENSRLEKWFPITAERLARLEQWARDCRDQVLYPAAQREDAKYGLYPHHCEPADVAALVRRLEALADPAQETTPSYADTDWRTLAGVTARVIKYLRGDDWRHGA